MQRWNRYAWSLLAAGILACGDSSGPSTPANIVGSYNAGGTTSDGVSFGVFFTFTQDGTTVGGTFHEVSGPVGTVTGTVNGNKVTLQLTEPSPCAGTFTSSLTASNGGGTLNGSVEGSDCRGNITGNYTAIRH